MDTGGNTKVRDFGTDSRCRAQQKQGQLSSLLPFSISEILQDKKYDASSGDVWTPVTSWVTRARVPPFPCALRCCSSAAGHTVKAQCPTFPSHTSTKYPQSPNKLNPRLRSRPDYTMGRQGRATGGTFTLSLWTLRSLSHLG